MKKKLLLNLLLLVSLFTLAGCGRSEKKNNEVERESMKNQVGYKEGKYTEGNLTFDLPDGYEKDGDSRYVYRDSSNALIVNIYIKEHNGTPLDSFIKKDDINVFPNRDSLVETDINGNKWLKGKSTDNATIYYIKEGKEFYVVSLEPIFTTKGMVDNLITTVEQSLYFK